MAHSAQAQQAPPPRRGRNGKERPRRREERPARDRREPERIFPDPKLGLTTAQASELLERGLGNEAVASNAKTTGQIIRENTLTFFNLVFVVLAALLVVSGNFRDMMFLGIAVVNSVIGIIQQLRSRATLEKLTLLSEARVKVVRDGQLGTVPVHKLVREDIVELGAGDQIPADGPVMSGQVTVNEALITGEADPSQRTPAMSCSAAALWCPANAAPVWIGWGRPAMLPGCLWRPRPTRGWAVRR